MKRLAVLVPVAAVAAAAAVPPAGAGTFKGIVVKRDAARHTIAVASPSGVVRTVRTHGLRAAGTRVSASAAKLADGTFRASRVATLGRARAARIHGVVSREPSSRSRPIRSRSPCSRAATARPGSPSPFRPDSTCTA